MSMIDAQTEPAVTTAELSEELIFLIAAVSTDTQRKRAIDLFRRFARQIEAEAYRRGCDSVRAPVVTREAQPSAATASALPPDHRVSLIPPINWQD